MINRNVLFYSGHIAGRVNLIFIIGMKSGQCPQKPSAMELFSPVKKSCKNDWMCVDGDKCCAYGGTTKCEQTIFKHNKGWFTFWK